MTSEHFQVLSLLLFCVLHSSEQTCPSKCFCMSDTVRCSSVGLHELPQSLPSFPTNLDFSHNHIIRLDPDTLTMTPRLEKLWMAHNEIRTLSHNVFRNVSGLRLLDLSSNRLQMVEQHYFQGLWRLEELRLFNNRITQVEGSSLSGLSSLKKVYFSFNQITHFPFFFIQDHTHPFLAMLDLSSNRMSSLPWEDVKALPQLVQQGLYTHNNSFICNCSMYDMFRHWNLSKYNSIKDFTDEHTCNVNGDPCKSIRFFRDNGFFQNCTEKPIIQPETDLPDVVVFEGNRVHLDCQTSISSTNLSFTWLSPSRGFITQSSMNDTRINMFPDGTLEIHATTTNNSAGGWIYGF
ncbi:amphoterin-induced protein 3-like isoform X2 [Poeciliopsis prolifica]|uniref:amphoterin-induced protein 3-like isoform X2 n=1 Tax=Poeciliopsis prolifica TaxID=188132 RepID=UPI0024137BB6|nr:amphoterin-induced protein 3-like isoform X2 [Poeciliopsis prolifica]